MKTTRRYPKEVRERAVRMVLDHCEEYNSEWATMRSIASKFGMTRGALRIWVRRVFNENYSVCGARKVWRQLHREGHRVERNFRVPAPDRLWVADLNKPTHRPGP